MSEYQEGYADGARDAGDKAYDEGYDAGWEDCETRFNNRSSSNEVLLHLLDGMLDQVELEYDGMIITKENIREIVLGD